jgi:glycosyltransferase involved in cell wall biosynthesis
VPPNGYGGIEVVLDGLIHGLKKRGVEVEIFSVGETKIRGVKNHPLYKTGQYGSIARPMYDSLPIVGAHIQHALNIIKNDGHFDIIHDHNVYYGPLLLAHATKDRGLPPVVHTNHGPPFANEQTLASGIPDNMPFWQYFASFQHRTYLVGISKALMKPAKRILGQYSLEPVYNAVGVEKFLFRDKKRKYFITLARFTRDKAQHVAAELCDKLGYELRMAGSVAGITSPRQLALELANPMSEYRGNPDFKYYSDKLLTLTIKNDRIKNVGDVSGMAKQRLMANARALLFPIDWEEPFGMAVIEALACGTPVVAMNRGAMPEIIQHGVNGFLANTVEEFEEYMQRVDEIDPYECRRSVESLFSSDVMAEQYIERYHEVIELTKKRR